MYTQIFPNPQNSEIRNTSAIKSPLGLQLVALFGEPCWRKYVTEGVGFEGLWTGPTSSLALLPVCCG